MYLRRGRYLKGAISRNSDKGRSGELPPKTISQAAGSAAWCSWWWLCSGTAAAAQLPARRYALPNSDSDVEI